MEAAHRVQSYPCLRARWHLRQVIGATNRNTITQTFNRLRARNRNGRRGDTNSPRHSATRITSDPTAGRQHRHGQHQPRCIMSTLVHTTHQHKYRNNGHDNNSERYTRLARHPRRCNGHRSTPEVNHDLRHVTGSNCNRTRRRRT